MEQKKFLGIPVLGTGIQIIPDPIIKTKKAEYRFYFLDIPAYFKRAKRMYPEQLSKRLSYIKGNMFYGHRLNNNKGWFQNFGIFCLRKEIVNGNNSN